MTFERTTTGLSGNEIAEALVKIRGDQKASGRLVTRDNICTKVKAFQVVIIGVPKVQVC